MNVRHLSVVVVIVLTTLVSLASPAAALSCIGYQDDAHLGIAAGDRSRPAASSSSSDGTTSCSVGWSG